MSRTFAQMLYDVGVEGYGKEYMARVWPILRQEALKQPVKQGQSKQGHQGKTAESTPGNPPGAGGLDSILPTSGCK